MDFEHAQKSLKIFQIIFQIVKRVLPTLLEFILEDFEHAQKSLRIF